MLVHIFVFFLLVSKIANDSEKCVCVPFWLCSNEGLVPDVEYNAIGDEKYCEGYFNVCCKVNCGQRNANSPILDDIIRSRLLGTGAGNEADFAEFPWMLAILYVNAYHCGESLIHPQVALTVAHCLHQSGIYKVRAGEWDWRSRREPLKHQDRIVKKIIVHPKYNPRTLINGIALLMLEEPFQLQDHVGVVCLPPQDAEPLPKRCTVSGWGRISPDGLRQSILKRTVFPMVPLDKCEVALQRAHLGSSFQLHSSFMCAGGAEKDVCKGGGGSPLMCPVPGQKDKFEQFGIVSWVLTCGVTNAPGVYVNVAQFIDWIDRQIALHGFDNRFYKI